MAELMLFRQDADGRDVELSGSTVALEVELQRRVEAGLEQMLGIRFVASEYATGPWHRGRIDTLGLDENGSPVVIEFKKGSDSGVLSQAVSYLSWLRSAQHEFIVPDQPVGEGVHDEPRHALSHGRVPARYPVTHYLDREPRPVLGLRRPRRCHRHGRDRIR
ncbi:hypothetical protein [Streptomyces sp. NPDC002394]